jgi:hypothetical protein
MRFRTSPKIRGADVLTSGTGTETETGAGMGTGILARLAAYY